MSCYHVPPTTAGAREAQSCDRRLLRGQRLVRNAFRTRQNEKKKKNMESTTDANVMTAKVVTMVCLFGVSMIVGCLPLLISLKFNWFTASSDPNLRSSNQLVMGLLAFGGGVLFATTFMHLLPEVDENIQLLQGECHINECLYNKFFSCWFLSRLWVLLKAPVKLKWLWSASKYISFIRFQKIYLIYYF